MVESFEWTTRKCRMFGWFPAHVQATRPKREWSDIGYINIQYRLYTENPADLDVEIVTFSPRKGPASMKAET